MTPRKADARPKVMKSSIKAYIAKRATEEPFFDRTLLAKEIIKEIEEMREVSPTLDTTIHYISDFRNRNVEDVPWNTAALEKTPIDTDIIPWLMVIAGHLKEWHSKPLNQREAKWYSRLFGFKTLIMENLPEDIKSLNEISQAEYVTFVIFTWAQIYAYREKLDLIVRTKEPGYSDLDNAIVRQDLLMTCQNDKEWQGLAGKIEKNPEFFIAQRMKYLEIAILGHSLGVPDMTGTEFMTYFTACRVILENDSMLELFRLQSQKIRIQSLINLRFLAKEKPGLNLMDAPREERDVFYEDMKKDIERLEKDGAK